MKHADICGISKFVERDIDMLLAEELRVSATFCEWILSKFEIYEDVLFPAISTNVSVVEDGSEADVIATFGKVGGGIHRLFVEDKIDAKLMLEQLERYVRRGEGDVRRGLINSFSVLFFTPSSYLCAVLPPAVRQISFEEAAGFFEAQKELRASYRASLLDRALPLRTPAERDVRVVESDPYIKEWWDTVYAMLEKEYPGFFIHKTLYPRSVYFAPETPGQARYLRVDFKGHKGEVDLAFKNISYRALSELVSRLGNAPGHVVANDKSAAIQISGLNPFVISDGLDVIGTKVLAAYDAAHKLLMFWKQNQAAFDALVAPKE